MNMSFQFTAPERDTPRQVETDAGSNPIDNLSLVPTKLNFILHTEVKRKA
jgi:hypothetical protein